MKKSDNWTYSWKDLPKKEKGEEIKYTVKEVGEISGYEAEVNNDDPSDITIKNIHKPNPPKPEPKPEPKDPKPKDKEIKPVKPKTGDDSNMITWILILLASGIIPVGILVKRNKK